MMQEPSELDLAELRSEMRRLYRNIGYGACLQVLYEMLKGAEVLSEIMLEERANERRDAGNA